MAFLACLRDSIARRVLEGWGAVEGHCMDYEDGKKVKSDLLIRMITLDFVSISRDPIFYNIEVRMSYPGMK